MTYSELAELLQVSESSIARKMKDLQASGEIRRVGADKNGHWECAIVQEGRGKCCQCRRHFGHGSRIVRRKSDAKIDGKGLCD